MDKALTGTRGDLSVEILTFAEQCFECGKERGDDSYTVSLNDGEWAHEDCYIGDYSLCCGAIINSETGFCSKCRD